MKRLGEITKKTKRKFTVKPRYTVVLHDVREKLSLSLNTYAIIDSVHKLSRNNPDYPYCTMSKEDIAAFLKLSRPTVFRAIQEGEAKGLLQRTKEGFLRTTQRWVETVEIYSLNSR